MASQRLMCFTEYLKKYIQFFNPSFGMIFLTDSIALK